MLRKYDYTKKYVDKAAGEGTLAVFRIEIPSGGFQGTVTAIGEDCLEVLINGQVYPDIIDFHQIGRIRFINFVAVNKREPENVVIE